MYTCIERERERCTYMADPVEGVVRHGREAVRGVQRHEGVAAARRQDVLPGTI